MAKPRTGEDYDDDVTAASRSALAELALAFGAYRDALVLIGGWAPYLILEVFGAFQADAVETVFVHVGSIDVDFVVDPSVIDAESYATIVELLLDRPLRAGCGFALSVRTDHRLAANGAPTFDPRGLPDSTTAPRSGTQASAPGRPAAAASPRVTARTISSPRPAARERRLRFTGRSHLARCKLLSDMTKPPLPEYKSPPVIEVVCGAQFEPLPGFLSVHFGDFWQRIKSNYPRSEDRPPLSDVREIEQGTMAQAELFDLPLLRRTFYIDATGNFLLQVQPSRFLANWRKERAEDTYPRYETAMRRFKEGWTTFAAFAKDAGLGVPQTNQYELTYINHIPEGVEPYPVGIEQFIPALAWKAAQSTGFLPSPQSAALRLQFALPGGRGRLHVTLNHGRRQDGPKNVLVLDLTARGPAQADWSDMGDWFSTAHEWIVRGFTDLTSGAAHQTWGRER